MTYYNQQGFIVPDHKIIQNPEDKFISKEEYLTFEDVLIVPQYSDIMSRNGELDISWKLGDYVFNIPIISAPMSTISGPKMLHKMAELGGLGILHRYMEIEEMADISSDWFKEHKSKNKWKQFPLALSVGSWYNDLRRIEFILTKLKKKDVIICIDIAHGHSEHMTRTIKYLRQADFVGPIIAGNVATIEGVGKLIMQNSCYEDKYKITESKNIKNYIPNYNINIQTNNFPIAISCGVGPGSVCKTRIKTGVGISQLQAILNCCYYKKNLIIADGGCKTAGDVCKSLACGAICTKIGGLLAGSDCCEGWKYNKKELDYMGMASKEAQEKFKGKYTNEEGIAIKVKNKGEGSTEAIIKDIVEGIKSSMSYVGAHNLEEFREKAKFIRVSNSTAKENRPHFYE